MQSQPPVRALDPETIAFYRDCLNLLLDADVPFLVGGAYAFGPYTGIQRHTKDLDIFIRKRDLSRVLNVFSEAGYRTEQTFPHWLSKVFGDDAFIDIIHSSGNGIAKVDDEWFAHARNGEVLGVDVLLCPPEDMVWSKGFVMERERYDGADIAHLLRAFGDKLDWDRLVRRFEPHPHVLLSHLVLFRFIYPDEAGLVPDAVMNQLIQCLRPEPNSTAAGTHLCRGTLLSREQYLVDFEQWGYQDARLPPFGDLTPEEVKLWTAGIDWNKV